MLMDDDRLRGRRSWDIDEDINLKRLLKMNVRLRSGRNTKKYTLIGLVLFVLLFLLALLFGVKAAGKLLFAGNSRFTVSKLYIKEGAVLNSSLIKEYMKIGEGKNLFGFDITQVRRDFLGNVPNVESVEISRELPDTLRVAIIERVPLARLSGRGQFVVDNKGYVFLTRSGSNDIPVIMGYDLRGLKPGDRIGGMGLAGVEAIDVCGDQQVGIHITEVDIKAKDYVFIRLWEGKSAMLSWDKMGEMTQNSHKNLTEKMLKLSKVLMTEKGKQSSEFDLTYADKIYSR